MTYDGLRVEHAALAGAAGDMRVTVAAMQARLDALGGELAPLHADWEGAQQQAFQRAKSAWDNAMHEMGALLDSAHRAVDEADVGYRAADARGANRFGG